MSDRLWDWRQAWAICIHALVHGLSLPWLCRASTWGRKSPFHCCSLLPPSKPLSVPGGLRGPTLGSHSILLCLCLSTCRSVLSLYVCQFLLLDQWFSTSKAHKNHPEFSLKEETLTSSLPVLWFSALNEQVWQSLEPAGLGTCQVKLVQESKDHVLKISYPWRERCFILGSPAFCRILDHNCHWYKLMSK